MCHFLFTSDNFLLMNIEFASQDACDYHLTWKGWDFSITHSFILVSKTPSLSLILSLMWVGVGVFTLFSGLSGTLISLKRNQNLVPGDLITIQSGLMFAKHLCMIWFWFCICFPSQVSERAEEDPEDHVLRGSWENGFAQEVHVTHR